MNKLTRTEAINLLKDYLGTRIPKLKWYQQIKPYLKAIIFYGSTAKGLNKPGSDLDIIIFVPLEIEEKYTKGEYFYKYKRREINIVLKSIENLRKMTDDAEVFRNCEILYESDPVVRELIKRYGNE